MFNKYANFKVAAVRSAKNVINDSVLMISQENMIQKNQR